METALKFLAELTPALLIGILFAIVFSRITRLKAEYDTFKKWDYTDIKADVKELCLKKYDYITRADFQVLLNNQYIHFEKKITDLEAEVKILKAHLKISNEK